MPEPDDVLTEGAAIRLAGDNVIGRETVGASVMLGDAATVIIADPLDGLDVSGVWNGSRFHLHGPLVGDVGVRLFGHPPDSPKWSWTRSSDGRPVHLLTRLPEGCVYLGVGRPVQGGYADGCLTFAALTIEPELTLELLDRVRPPSELGTLPNLDWLARMTASPLEALAQFVEGWIPEIDQDLGDFVAAPWDVPEPLAVFYRLARRRPALLGVQNRLRSPRTWEERRDGLIAFGDENQGGFIWLFDPSQPDPEVWIDEDGDGVRREHQPMSGFLLQFALFEAMMNAPYKALHTALAVEHVDKLAAALTPVPWEPWRWPNDSTRFYVAPGVIATTMDQWHGNTSAWVGAVHRSVLRPLRQLGIPWEHFDG
ncbi:hypothetical protein F8568_021900 [Actinomadura sp. LD22]|uniref:Uncharacterized protein n=1 Tax=Actinomadura physcomitrii TaxID=2650748 RepID=A0A6I4MGX9_9ACTN|nr:hypothetical protein [Actinomadura physcomitrii]MWA02981.1 hypothetical protein [Actinomadura physcomitrii]